MFRVQRAGLLTGTAVVVGLEVLRCSCAVDDEMLGMDVVALIERSRSDAIKSNRSISSSYVTRLSVSENNSIYIGHFIIVAII
jgi:hypothetical protein